MMVAVAVFRPSDEVFPPQQSPILGHRASSHTVCKFSPRKSFFILLKDSPEGTDVLRYVGSRGLGSRVSQKKEAANVKTHLFVLPSTTRSDFPMVSRSPERKSSSVGPLSSALPNLVLLRDDAVARQRL
jgi:hypothetical protein